MFVLYPQAPTAQHTLCNCITAHCGIDLNLGPVIGTKEGQCPKEDLGHIWGALWRREKYVALCSIVIVR